MINNLKEVFKFEPLIKKRISLCSKTNNLYPIMINIFNTKNTKSYYKDTNSMKKNIETFHNENIDDPLSLTFRNNKSSFNFLIGIILGKFVIKNYLKIFFNKHIQFSQIFIKKNEYGKPIVFFNDEKVNIDNLHLSISHKDDWNIAAVSFKKIGIDIEKVRYFNNSLLKRIFTNYEIDNANEVFHYLIPNNFNSDLNLAYTCMFSIKEAVSKAMGLGLRIDFQKINLNFNDDRIKIKINQFKNSKDEYYTIIHLINNYIFTLVEKIP